MKIYFVYVGILLIISNSVIYCLRVSYEIAFATAFMDDRYIFLKRPHISLDECAVECVRRPGCLAISFCRRFPLCNLLNSDELSKVAFTSTHKDNCDFVRKSGMRYNLPAGCQDCDVKQNCDFENEKCTITECQKMSLDNGVLLGNMNGLGNRVQFKCNRGYRVETGESYAICEETGNWSTTPKCVKECPKLSLDNGLLIGEVDCIVGDRVYFECKSGYRADTGENYTTCQETGNWSIAPKCVKECPKLSLDNGLLIGDVDGIVGDRAYFECKSGYRAETSENYTSCEETGNWSIAPKCVKECPKLLLDNGLLIGDVDGIVGDRVYFECKSGYRTDTGENYTTCEETGIWSTTPKCVKECPKLSLDNGLLLVNAKGIVGDRVYFVCNSGYRADTGESYTTCEDTGNWSITPQCVKECPVAWVSFRESCYKVGITYVTLDNAKAECALNEAHLAHIDDEAENIFIKNNLLSQETEFWIGLTDSSETSTSRVQSTRFWKWMDDDIAASVFDWASGEPDNVNEKCVVMNKPGWHDVHCSRSFQPICEK